MAKYTQKVADDVAFQAKQRASKALEGKRMPNLSKILYLDSCNV